MPLPIFPAHLFNPKEVNARPVEQVISGGVALSGVEDVIATDGGGRWMIDYTGIDLRTVAQQKAWRAWARYLGGGSVECLVPLLGLSTAPRPGAWDRPVRMTRLVTDDPVFPTTTAFSLPHIIAEVGADAALRATSLQISLTSRGSITGGEQFSVGEYAYEVVRETAPGVFTIHPPLREAVTIGDPVNFDWPVVKCRLSPGQDIASPISLGRFSNPSITFVESPPVGAP